MSARKIHLLILVIAVGALTACNYTIGECWRRGERGEGSEGAGAGFGESSVAVGAGPGDFGDTPGEQNGDEPLQCNKTDEDPKEGSPKEGPSNPQAACPEVGDMAGDGATFLSCSDACSSKCPPPGMAPFLYVDFNPSDFLFVTTLPDDGTDDGGGWQEARANLKFEHKVIPGGSTEWYCPLIIGMPLRTKFMGRIDPIRAASLSEEVTEDVANNMDYKLPPGIFCSRFRLGVEAAFKLKYPQLGASVKKG